MIEVDGWVIVPPLNEWDREHKDRVWNKSYSSFATTTVEAWKRHIHPTQYEYIDFGTIVQRWHDRGYRPIKAKLEIYDETID